MPTLQNISDYVDEQVTTLSSHRLFTWLSDKKIPGTERLSFAPAMYRYIMDFPRILETIKWSTEKSNLGIVLENYCAEDDYHWAWYLQDLERLNLSKNKIWTDIITFSRDFNDVDRLVSYRAAKQIIELAEKHTDTVCRTAIVITFETVGLLFLKSTNAVTIDAGLSDTLHYFGNEHLKDELNHTKISSDLLMTSVTEEQFRICRDIIECMCETYDEMFSFWYDSRNYYK